MSVFRENLLEGRVALITGGATGIGREIAHVLGEHGAAVAIASRKRDKLEATCAELTAEGINAMWGQCDVRQPEQVQAVVEQVLQRHGRIDFLINNAAGNFPAPVSGISCNGFKAVVDIDLLGSYNATKIVFEAWQKDHGGAIVNISAPFQNQGVAMQSHVAAAKAGVDSLTRSCAVEFGRHGIRVNAVAPGSTAETEGMARFGEAVPGSDHMLCPLGFMGEKRDIANAVLFLVSDAARYITGQVFAVDGGAGIDMLKLRL